jgi:Ca-activated chloride channel family protein
MKQLMVVLFFFIGAKVFAQTADQHIYSGNKLYAKGKYKEAASEYQKGFAAKKNREAQYNLGNALYQQKDFEKAAKQYEEASNNSKDRSIKSFSNHNIGNSYSEQKKWDDAINYYKKSLKQNPNSADTKYNLAYAQKMKQQQDQKDKEDNKQDQKDNQDQNGKEDQKKPEDPKDDKKKDKGNIDPQKPEEKQGDKPKPMPSKLTKQRADQILNALNDEEKKLREKKDKAVGNPVKLDKDW